MKSKPDKWLREFSFYFPEAFNKGLRDFQIPMEKQKADDDTFADIIRQEEAKSNGRNSVCK